jgi:hypothetical protein
LRRPTQRELMACSAGPLTIVSRPSVMYTPRVPARHVRPVAADSPRADRRPVARPVGGGSGADRVMTAGR